MAKFGRARAMRETGTRGKERESEGRSSRVEQRGYTWAKLAVARPRAHLLDDETRDGANSRNLASKVARVARYFCYPRAGGGS